MNKRLYIHNTIDIIKIYVIPPVIFFEIYVGDFFKSTKPYLIIIKKHTLKTKPQLAIGPQKWIVRGPVGDLIKDFNHPCETGIFKA